MNALVTVRVIGAKVKETRIARSITQKQLATKADVSERLVRQLESGKATGIGLDKLSAILSALDLSLSFSDTPKRIEPVTQGDDYESAFNANLIEYGVVSLEPEE